AAGRHPAGPCAAPGTVWRTAHSRRTTRRRTWRQPQAGRAAHATAWHPGAGAAPLSSLHDRQQAFAPRGGKPAGPELCRRAAGSDLAGRYHLYPDRRGLALPGRDPRPVHPQSGRLGDARSPACRTHHRRAHHGNPTTTSGSRAHSSDRGSQYAAGDYRDILQAAAVVQSMSRKGNCWDNAPMESFFGTLKTELVHQDEYPNRDAARRDLFVYIEGYYNRQRRHSAIGYITPEQAEAKSA